MSHIPTHTHPHTHHRTRGVYLFCPVIWVLMDAHGQARGTHQGERRGYCRREARNVWVYYRYSLLRDLNLGFCIYGWVFLSSNSYQLTFGPRALLRSAVSSPLTTLSTCPDPKRVTRSVRRLLKPIPKATNPYGGQQQSAAPIGLFSTNLPLPPPSRELFSTSPSPNRSVFHSKRSASQPPTTQPLNQPTSGSPVRIQTRRTQSISLCPFFVSHKIPPAPFIQLHLPSSPSLAQSFLFKRVTDSTTPPPTQLHHRWPLHRLLQRSHSRLLTPVQSPPKCFVKSLYRPPPSSAGNNITPTT